jgi:hypothetical protein
MSTPTVRENVGVAVVYAGMADRHHGEGVLNLARAVNQHTQFNVVVDDNALLAGGLDDYALICVVAQRAFQFSPEEQNALQAYVQNGGTVFFESCRRDSTSVPGSDQSFQELITTFGVKAADAAKSGHALLRQPNLFVGAPAGYEMQGTLLAGGGVVMTTADYGCLWAGDQRNGAASREAIRSAIEFGENLISYAADRRKMVHS